MTIGTSISASFLVQVNVALVTLTVVVQMLDVLELRMLLDPTIDQDLDCLGPAQQ